MKTNTGVAITLALATLAWPATAATHYVSLQSTNPVSPYADWGTAATNIQDAVDAATDGDAVLVTNGVYRTGGRTVTAVLTNRVTITQAMTVQSVNGPTVTSIEGWQVPGTIVGDSAVRCAYLADGAALIGFTLTNGATRLTSSDVEGSGGGAWCQSTNAILSNCVVVANSCYWRGAGACFGTLFNCEVIANTNLNACFPGGAGAASSRLHNCRLSGNWTSVGVGGGALSCYLTNCVLTGNHDAGATQSTLDNCLVTANNGTGINGGVANNCTISSNTPAPGINIYGGGASGATLNNCALYRNQAFRGGGAYNCSLNFCGLSNNWATDEGGGIYGLDGARALSNCTIAGNQAANNGGGAVLIGTVTACTFSNNSAGGHGGGAYFSGFAISNCLFLLNSAAGSGGGVYCASPTRLLNRCSFLTNQAGMGGGVYWGTLSNCVLNANSATIAGGGAYFGTLTRCLLEGNQAGNGGGIFSSSSTACTLVNNSAVTNGGGACDSTLRNCLLMGNAANSGGGGYNDYIYNCTIVANSATNSGGGIVGGSGTYNSILYYNTAPSSSNYIGSSFNSCCTVPLPTGTGNITNAPVFVDFAGGNLRLQTNSPCIDKGNNNNAQGPDRDGRPRIVGVKVDIGAYEFQGAGMGEFASWLQKCGLPTDGSADFTDSDSDRMNNWQEWIAGTEPTNAGSALRLLFPGTNSSGLTVTWQSVTDRTYFLDRATDLSSAPAFLPLATNLPGQSGATTFTDTNAVGDGPFFYRVGVQP